MRKCVTVILSAIAMIVEAGAADFREIPFFWKWISNNQVVFTYDGSFTDDKAFAVKAGSVFTTVEGVKAPRKYTSFPVRPEGAVNLTYSPDSTMLAYTRANDLYVCEIASGREHRLTHDGSDVILNGFASWVYYEEIFGRSSMYKAFWWSDDSKTLAFYRFDNSEVTMFPIYSAAGSSNNYGEPAVFGRLNETRYPLAGQTNPSVRIGFASISDWGENIVWADFDEKEDQYFGTPFWGPKGLYVAREPRIQNTLDLYCVSPEDGSKTHIYHEKVDTWLEWMEDMLFTKDGLYMVRDFETGYQQIYFLSYDGKKLQRITDGPNWRVSLIRCDSKHVFFRAQRDGMAKSALYSVSLDKKHEIVALTDPSLNASLISFSPDGEYFVAELDNFTTPTQIWIYKTEFANQAWRGRAALAAASAAPQPRRRMNDQFARSCYKVADMATEEFDASKYALPQLIRLKTPDGFVIPGAITYPYGFDKSKKYPVHFEIYGGPNTAYVRDSWRTPGGNAEWFARNGIIHITADVRSSGHCGRKGLDEAYKHLNTKEIDDFVMWGKSIQALPYVKADKIGVEGFSFGGTNTTQLLLEHSDVFHYGIAGGGVYDWRLYDSHYTERFMETPQTNPDGYEGSCVLKKVDSYPVKAGAVDGSVMLRITHGTGDDNVHFQSTLLLIDALERAGKGFEMYIYPDGMHGYRGPQGRHSVAADRDFWKKYLLGE